MAKSIFLNFDPERYCLGKPEAMCVVDVDIRGITSLLMNCVEACSRTELQNGILRTHRLNNEEFSKLADRFRKLTELKVETIFKTKKTAFILEIDERITYDSSAAISFASLLPKISDYEDVSITQLQGLKALWYIDEVLTIVVKKGWCNEAVEAILLAAFWESKSRGQSSVDYMQLMQNIHESKVEDHVKQRQSATSKKASDKRLVPLRAMKKEAERLYADGAPWPSRRQAAKAIAPMIQVYGRKNFDHVLSDDRVEITVYEWLTASDKKIKQS